MWGLNWEENRAHDVEPVTWKEDEEKELEYRHRCFEGMACRIAIINIKIANEYTLCKFCLHPMPRFNETCPCNLNLILIILCPSYLSSSSLQLLLYSRATSS